MAIDKVAASHFYKDDGDKMNVHIRVLPRKHKNANAKTAGGSGAGVE